MKIIKRNGQHEEFSLNKLRLSVTYASDQSNKPLNKGDLDVVFSEIMEIIGNRESIKSAHIKMITTGVLYVLGFKEISKLYSDFSV
jgi:transcriptional regulator NrdR family protein